ncbi:MAG: hypothetical protein IKQ77_03015, partial [Prevotella sp.]|nr:hypothetical protein [Prevotella sp.]
MSNPLVRTPHWRSGGHKTRPYDFGGHSCHGDAGKRRPLVSTPTGVRAGTRPAPTTSGDILATATLGSVA